MKASNPCRRAEQPPPAVTPTAVALPTAAITALDTGAIAVGNAVRTAPDKGRVACVIAAQAASGGSHWRVLPPGTQNFR
jgi:hypothetical protein